MNTEHEFSDMLVVSEEVVMLCSEQHFIMYGDTEPSNFDRILKEGSVLKHAGRTPVYLCSQDMKQLTVTSLEKLQKNYN